MIREPGGNCDFLVCLVQFDRSMNQPIEEGTVTALKPQDRIIHPLDMPDGAEALKVVDRLSPLVGMFKVGLELFNSRRGGWPFVDQLRSIVGDDRIMLDLKLDDIIATMRGAIGSIRSPDGPDGLPFAPRFLTVHTQSGTAHVAACVDAAGPSIGILGVTVLTSVDQEMWVKDKCQGILQDEIRRRAGNAVDAKVAGIVCSAQDLGMLQALVPPTVVRVCPGIRPAGDAQNDQKRPMTPGEAYAAGADYMVIGRPISEPKTGTSEDAVKRICDEIASARRVIS